MLLCVCFHTRTTHFTFTLRLRRWNLLNNGSKNQNLCLLVEYVTVWTNLGTGGGTKHQQSFLFGSEGRNALVSSDKSMLSKCDDNHVRYGASEYPNETNAISPKSRESLLSDTFLKHSDRIRGSKVIKHLRTIVIFSRGRLSLSLRVKGLVHPKMNILSLLCRSKPVRHLFIFRTRIKIFLMKSKSFLALHRQQRNWHVQGPER